MLTNIDKNQINGTAANIAKQLDAVLIRAQEFRAWLLTIPDATLISTYGYVQGDIDTLRSGLTDMDKLASIQQGTVTQGTTYDFRTFTKLFYPYGPVV